MALEIARFFKKDGVFYKERLIFLSPEEAGISEDDVRLITLEDQEGKWFWYMGYNHRSIDRKFFDDTVPVKDRQWDPYKHPLEEGIVFISEEEYVANT
jgi:hypothetical protein